MRIVLINWAPIEHGAGRGGGVNGYCQGLALALMARGHEVVSLRGGTAFEPGASPPEPGPCVIRRHADWRDIRIFEVVNSPVLAPALPQFRDPLGEVSSPELERLIANLIAELRPHAVHIHSLEGLTAGCIAAIRIAAPACRLLFSLHNYHTICPQVYLMQGHRRPCFSFDKGHACDGCIPSVDPGAERCRLASGSSEPVEFEWIKPGAQPEPRGLRAVVSGLLRREATPTPSRPPDPWSEAGMSRPAWRPLANTPTPEPESAKPPNAYAARRRAMIDALNRCDAVLAVSAFVHEKFRAMGVDAPRLRTLHIGTRLADHARRSTAPPPLGNRPIRLAFMGYHNWYKGLPMLADSLEMLVPEILSRIHLKALVLNGGEMEPQLRRLEPHLAGLDLRGGYNPDDLPGLLQGVDLGIVPSVWWDNAPQTVMEFLACGIPVLGADLGGIPDFIQDRVNGLLFRGNDRWDLARRLASLARDPSILGTLRAAVRPPKGMAEHALELEALYSGRVS